MNEKKYIRKPVFDSNSKEIICQTCFWLLQFVGGDCGCALRYPWPSETNGECEYFIKNWDTEKDSNEQN